MWARVIELMLGCWLTITPFVFRGTPRAAEYAINDVIAGSLVILFSLLCFWRRARRAHMATLGLGLWLACYGYFSAERPGPPAAQNDIVVGLLLLVFAIVPSEATQPPRPWRRDQRLNAP